MELFIFIPRVLKADGWMETELEKEGGRKEERKETFQLLRSSSFIELD